MNRYLMGLVLILIRLQRRVLERRISKMFDIKLSLDVDKCLAVEDILKGAET